ncbi:MAG: (d)CMP kinase [Alphaproteobacteria bacterium]|nr:(d)CMP kinase [Alphaproteobacteria bacterium]
MTEPIILAIDGPAASGKGTLCRRLAAQFDFALLDTGLLYRAVAQHCALTGIDLDDEITVGNYVRELTSINTEQTHLRSETVGMKASTVSKYPAVRKVLLDYQRQFGSEPPSGGGAILDGRDIGTVIFPDTPYKIFLTASAQTRAQRRFLEMQQAGNTPHYSAILDDVRRRDTQDRNRAIAPLIPAEDAVVINSSDLDVDQVFAKAIEFLYARGLNR